ncbi:DMT family transporter [Salarchaeum sp. III]|uniref:DMT family transporter n=1 Tax=Salarchaeum sp. III TaxID=3107927 RepID=UPI002ED8C323
MAALAVAVAAVSTSAILVEASSAPSLVKAFYRVLFTTACILPFARGHGDAIRSFDRADLAVAVVSGVALALHFAAWFESLNWTSVAASVTLVQTQPLFVALGAAVLLGERLTRRMLAGILVAVAGAAVMALGEPALGGASVLSTFLGSGALYGDLLAVAGALAASVYVLAGRSLRQRVALVPYTLVVYSVCTLTLLGFVLAAGHPLLSYPAPEWALFAAMALGPGLFGHTVVNWALEHVESSVVSVSLLGEPLGSTLLALLVFAEVPGAATIVGGAVVLAGITATARARQSA